MHYVIHGGRLTDIAVRKLRARSRAFKQADGRGLCLLVQPNGAKWWRFRYRWDGKEQMLSLGTYPDTSLAEARQERELCRNDLSNHVNPAVRRATESLPERTFKAVAEHWLSVLDKKVRQGKRSRKTYNKAKWALETYVFPEVGPRQINSITTPELLAVLKKIESKGLLETARRTKQRCGQVLRHAIGLGYCTRDLTIDMRGLLEAPTVTHHAALTKPKEVGQLLRDINAYTGRRLTVLALKLAPLVFVRPGELRKAERAHFDLAAAEWRICKVHMKRKIEHTVPLSVQAIAIVKEILTLNPQTSRWLFPAQGNIEKPMSENTVNDALRAMGYASDEQTGQGFRTVASTLLNEQGWPPDAIERQLSHQEEDEVRGSYNQAEYMRIRRRMMQAWGDYLDELRADNTAAVRDFEQVAARHSGPRKSADNTPILLAPSVNPINSSLLLSDSMQFASTLHFSIGASFQIAGIEPLPPPAAASTTPAGRASGEDVEVERSRRADGTFSGHDLPL